MTTTIVEPVTHPAKAKAAYSQALEPTHYVYACTLTNHVLNGQPVVNVMSAFSAKNKISFDKALNSDDNYFYPNSITQSSATLKMPLKTGDFLYVPDGDEKTNLEDRAKLLKDPQTYLGSPMSISNMGDMAYGIKLSFAQPKKPANWMEKLGYAMSKPRVQNPVNVEISKDSWKHMKDAKYYILVVSTTSPAEIAQFPENAQAIAAWYAHNNNTLNDIKPGISPAEQLKMF